MDDVRVNAAELKQALVKDMDALVNEVAEAMNAAEYGRIIADSEEPVQDANAVFRQRVYEHASQAESFFPSAQGSQEQG